MLPLIVRCLWTIKLLVYNLSTLTFGTLKLVSRNLTTSLLCTERKRLLRWLRRSQSRAATGEGPRPRTASTWSAGRCRRLAGPRWRLLKGHWLPTAPTWCSRGRLVQGVPWNVKSISLNSGAYPVNNFWLTCYAHFWDLWLVGNLEQPIRMHKNCIMKIFLPRFGTPWAYTLIESGLIVINYKHDVTSQC